MEKVNVDRGVLHLWGGSYTVMCLIGMLLLSWSQVVDAKPSKPWDVASQRERNAYIAELAQRQVGLQYPSTSKEWVKEIVFSASQYGLPQSRAIVLPDTKPNGYAWKDAPHISAVKKQLKAALPGHVIQMVWKDAKTKRSNETTVIVTEVSSRTVTFLENLPDPKRKSRNVIQTRLFSWSEAKKAVGSKFTIYEIQGGPAPTDERIVLWWPLETPKPSKPSTAFGADWGLGRAFCKDLPMTHTGVDIPQALNNPVYATADGNVKWITDGMRFGFAYGITIEHTHPVLGAYTTVSWHVVPAPRIKKGVQVTKGQKIGDIAEIDGTEHLHFGIRKGAYDSTYSDKGALPTNNDCPELKQFKENFLDPWNPNEVVFR